MKQLNKMKLFLLITFFVLADAIDAYVVDASAELQRFNLFRTDIEPLAIEIPKIWEQPSDVNDVMSGTKEYKDAFNNLETSVTDAEEKYDIPKKTIEQLVEKQEQFETVEEFERNDIPDTEAEKKIGPVDNKFTKMADAYEVFRKDLMEKMVDFDKIRTTLDASDVKLNQYKTEHFAIQKMWFNHLFPIKETKNLHNKNVKNYENELLTYNTLYKEEEDVKKYMLQLSKTYRQSAAPFKDWLDEWDKELEKQRTHFEHVNTE